MRQWQEQRSVREHKGRYWLRATWEIISLHIPPQSLWYFKVITNLSLLFITRVPSLFLSRMQKCTKQTGTHGPRSISKSERWNYQPVMTALLCSHPSQESCRPQEELGVIFWVGLFGFWLKDKQHGKAGLSILLLFKHDLKKNLAGLSLMPHPCLWNSVRSITGEAGGPGGVWNLRLCSASITDWELPGRSRHKPCTFWVTWKSREGRETRVPGFYSGKPWRQTGSSLLLALLKSPQKIPPLFWGPPAVLSSDPQPAHL